MFAKALLYDKRYRSTWREEFATFAMHWEHQAIGGFTVAGCGGLSTRDQQAINRQKRFQRCSGQDSVVLGVELEQAGFV